MLAPSQQPSGSSTPPEAPPTPQISPTSKDKEQGDLDQDQLQVGNKSDQVLEEGEGIGVVVESDTEDKCRDTDNVGDTLVSEGVVDEENLESEVKAEEKVLEVQLVTPVESEEYVEEEEEELVKQDVVEGVREDNVEVVKVEEDVALEEKDCLGDKESMDPLIDFVDRKEDEEEEGCDDDKKNGVVGATFVDFVMEPEPSESEDGKEEEKLGEEDKGEGEVDGEDDTSQMILMTGNPELQKIRAEQVRKWLIFEQDSAAAALSVGSSLSESMEADSLAVPLAGGGGGDGDGSEEGDELLALSNGEGDQGNPRRVRFLTDQEGNLLISVFMTKLVHLFLFFIKIASRGYLDFYVEPTHSFENLAHPSSQLSTPPYSSTTSSPRHSISSNSSQQSVIVNIETLNLLSCNNLQFSTPGVTTPLSEEPSLPGNETGDESGREEMMTFSPQSPSLVVSPPSLEHVGGNGEDGDGEELVDSIEPSAPPMEETPLSEGEDGEDDDEEEPPSIVLVVNPPKEPPREKPPAPPVGQNEDNDSSDDTLSVSSCNSMIEILPHSNEQEKMDLAMTTLEDNNNIENENEIVGATCLLGSSGPVALAPCFQLGDIDIKTEEGDELCEEDTSSSPQPASLIIHEVEEHSEGMAAQNGSSNIPVSKVPDVDENNNIVEDSVLEEGDLEDDDDEEPMPVEADTQVPQFNPEIGEQVKMPDLRRSTSSSDDGEAEDDGGGAVARRGSAANEHLLQVRMNRTEEDHHEQQMVSLCIQEEHISAVALTIAKWESMSKTQSTENLSICPTVPPSGPPCHAPVTKSSSSPCPKACSPQQLHRLLSSPGGSTGSGSVKPIQPVAPLHQQHRRDSGSPVVPPIPPAKPNRLVIHGSHSNPAQTEHKTVAKAAGWQCWGNKLKDGNPPTMVGEGGNSGGEGTHEEIIYAQPNPQAGSTMTSINNPSAILKAYPKPLSKGEIINWLKEGEVHRAGLLLNYAQTHHVPVIGHQQATGNNLSSVLVTWFFGVYEHVNFNP